MSIRRLRSTTAMDEGSILPLIAGASALALAVILVVTAVTSLYLDYKRLLSIADAAALVGAEAYDLSEIVVEGGTVVATLDPARVRGAVESHLGEFLSGPVPVDDLHLVRATSLDGRSATVTLAARWSPPLLAPFIPDGLPVEATSTARSVFG
jgi:hypothetical protein